MSDRVPLEIPVIDLIGAPSYFSQVRLQKTANLLTKVIGIATNNTNRGIFLQNLQTVWAIFEKEYSTTPPRLARFIQEKATTLSAERNSPRRYARAWRDVDFRRVEVDLPFHKVDLLLNQWASEIEDFYLSAHKQAITGRPVLLRRVIPEIRIFRLCEP